MPPEVRREDGVEQHNGAALPALPQTPSSPKMRQALTCDEVTWDDAMDAMQVLLRYIGEPERPGIQETPARVLRAWKQHWGAGYASPPPRLQLFKEEGVDYNQMVLVSGIDFFSSCEHHLAPFHGQVDIAYIPDARRGVLGLSKFARVVEYFCRRLQVQERLNAQIADFIAKHVSGNVGVVIRATHMCMTSRGVQKPNAITTTSSLRGEFLHDASTKAEFLRLTANSGRP